jgi:hypothetical protein
MARSAISATFCLLLGACAQPSPRTPAPRNLGNFGVVNTPAASPLFGPGGTGTTVLAVEPGMTGDRVSSLLEVPDDVCGLVIARGGPTIEDLDLSAYAEDGTPVGADEGPDKEPALMLCPPHPRRIWVSARIAAGHGLVALGAGRVRPADAARARRVYRVKAGPDDPQTSIGSIPQLDEKLASHRRDIGGNWQDVRRAPIPLDPRTPTRVSASIEAGRCLDALVVPAPDVGHVELLATDVNGAIVGRGQTAGRDRFLVVCATAETALALEIRPHSGRGMGLLLLSRTQAGSERDLIDPLRLDAFPTNELPQALAGFKERLERAGYRGGRSLLNGALEVGRRSSFPLHLPAGCSRLDLVGGAPLRGMNAWVWSPQNELAAALASGGQGSLFVCGRGGPMRLDAEATLRPGPVALLLHHEAGASTELAKSPLAASRLLAQVVERGVLRRASEVGLVRRFDLSEAAIEAFEITVPFGRCMDVALGLDKGAVGAEIRLVSAASGKEITLGRGPHATSARACALDADSVRENTKTRVELRVAAGAAAGLVATRMLSPVR